MPGYLPVMICLFKSSPFGPPAISTNVGSQSSDAKMSLKMVPGLMTPGHRMTHGARIPPSQVLNFPPLKGVVPPSGKERVSAPLSVVKTTMVLSSWPMSSSIFKYVSGRTVVTCIRAGLYQTKNGLLVFLGSLRSRKSTTWEEISSSTVFERSSVSGPSSWQVWFFDVPSDDLHKSTGRGGVRHGVSLGSTAPGTSGTPGISVFLQGGMTVWSVGVLLMSGKLTPCIASR